MHFCLCFLCFGGTLLIGGRGCRGHRRNVYGVQEVGDGVPQEAQEFHQDRGRGGCKGYTRQTGHDFIDPMDHIQVGRLDHIQIYRYILFR